MGEQGRQGRARSAELSPCWSASNSGGQCASSCIELLDSGVALAADVCLLHDMMLFWCVLLCLLPCDGSSTSYHASGWVPACSTQRRPTSAR